MVVKNLLSVTLYPVEIPSGVTDEDIREWCELMEISGLRIYRGHAHFKRKEDVTSFILRFH